MMIANAIVGALCTFCAWNAWKSGQRTWLKVLAVFAVLNVTGFIVTLVASQ